MSTDTFYRRIRISSIDWQDTYANTGHSQREVVALLYILDVWNRSQLHQHVQRKLLDTLKC